MAEIGSTGIWGDGFPERVTLVQQNATYSIWYSPHVDGIEIIESGLHLHDYPGHLHDSVEILWIQSGSGAIKTRARQYQFRAGEACIIGVNERHSGTSIGNEPFSFIAIQLPRSLLEQVLEYGVDLNDGMGNAVAIKILSRHLATELLPELLKRIVQAENSEQLKYGINKLVPHLFDAYTTINCPALDKAYRHPAVSRAKSIIREQCVTGININNLADVVRLDVRYLITLFKCGTGLTPHQYQIAVRVELARKLIQQNIPLRDVALMTGFSDQSHLNRHFKRQYGYSPGIFKHNVSNQTNFIQ